MDDSGRAIELTPEQYDAIKRSQSGEILFVTREGALGARWVVDIRPVERPDP